MTQVFQNSVVGNIFHDIVRKVLVERGHLAIPHETVVAIAGGNVMSQVLSDIGAIMRAAAEASCTQHGWSNISIEISPAAHAEAAAAIAHHWDDGGPGHAEPFIQALAHDVAEGADAFPKLADLFPKAKTPEQAAAEVAAHNAGLLTIQDVTKSIIKSKTPEWIAKMLESKAEVSFWKTPHDQKYPYAKKLTDDDAPPATGGFVDGSPLSYAEAHVKATEDYALGGFFPKLDAAKYEGVVTGTLTTVLKEICVKKGAPIPKDLTFLKSVQHYGLILQAAGCEVLVPGNKLADSNASLATVLPYLHTLADKIKEKHAPASPPKHTVTIDLESHFEPGKWSALGFPTGSGKTLLTHAKLMEAMQQATPEQKQALKKQNFGLLYGAGPKEFEKSFLAIQPAELESMKKDITKKLAESISQKWEDELLYGKPAPPNISAKALIKKNNPIADAVKHAPADDPLAGYTFEGKTITQIVQEKPGKVAGAKSKAKSPTPKSPSDPLEKLHQSVKKNQGKGSK